MLVFFQLRIEYISHVGKSDRVLNCYLSLRCSARPDRKVGFHAALPLLIERLLNLMYRRNPHAADIMRQPTEYVATYFRRSRR